MQQHKRGKVLQEMFWIRLSTLRYTSTVMLDYSKCESFGRHHYAIFVTVYIITRTYGHSCRCALIDTDIGVRHASENYDERAWTVLQIVLLQYHCACALRWRAAPDCTQSARKGSVNMTCGRTCKADRYIS